MQDSSLAHFGLSEAQVFAHGVYFERLEKELCQPLQLPLIRLPHLVKEPSPHATDTLSASLSGDRNARTALMALLYDDLRALANSRMGGERPDHTLQPTALVHEAYLRLIDQDQVDWQGKTHFFAVAATSMRRVLVDHARSRKAEKRGKGQRAEALSDDAAISWEDPGEIIDLDAALSKLATVQPRQAKTVELRFFGGLSLEETAQTLEVSRDTVKLDWRFARAWLNRELSTPDGE